MAEPPPSALARRTGEIYQEVAEIWDRQRDRSLFERGWLDRVRAMMPPGGAVLDIGCGGGEPIARYFIERGHPVTGVDLAPAMIELATRRFPDHTWLVQDMRDLALPQKFAAVLAFNSFFHLTPDEQRQSFSVLATHLQPGGVLWFSAGPAEGAITGTVGGQTVYHASLAPDAYRRLMSDNGLEALAFVTDDPDCRGHTLWLARKV